MRIKRKALIFLLATLPQWAFAFEAFVVEKIRVQGLKRVSEGAVLKALPVRKGGMLSERESKAAIQALYRTGLFKEVKLYREGNTLMIALVERPSIRSVKLEGVKDNEAIKKMMKEERITEGQILNPVQLLELQRKLEQYYLSQGKYAVKVDYRVEESEPGVADVIYQVYEGDIAKIKEIRFMGVCAFPEKELLKQMHHATTNFFSWFTSDDQYSKEKWQADLEIIRAYYMDRGYVDMRIESSQVSLTPDKKHIYLTIKISEGPQYRVGAVTVKGDLPIACETLEPALCKLKRDSVFSRKEVIEVKTELEEILGSQGYSFAEIEPIPEGDAESRVMSIVFRIDAKQRVYVRRINITGNVATQDEVLRRELTQMEAAPLSTRLINQGKDNILRKGYGSKVEVDAARVLGSPDEVDVAYQIEEAKMGNIGVGLEYSQAQRFGWNFNVSQENFLGTGKTVDFTFDQNAATTNYAFGYYDPYFTPDGIGMGFNAYFNKTDLAKTTSLSSYSTDTKGMDWRWVFPLSKYEFIRLDMGYADERIHAIVDNNSAIEIRNFFNQNGQKFQDFHAGITWGYDSLDRRLFPRKGFSQKLHLKGIVPGARLQYYQLTHDSNTYIPLTGNQRWIIHLATILGYGDGYGKTEQLPFFKFWSIGGARWVRGFEENSIGPKDSIGNTLGGNLLAAASVNLIFPNPIKPDAESIRTAVFLDLGQVYDTHYRTRTLPNGTIVHRNSCFRYSAGISLSWNSPVGPVMFSLAKPLNKKPGDNLRTFSIGAATNF